jgi:hypothetical protein
MKQKRLILGILLILLLFTLMLYYSVDRHTYEPSTYYILTHYEEFTTTNVQLDGVVQNVDTTNNTLLVRVDGSFKDGILVSTTEPVQTVHLGDRIELYGHFTSPNHLTAEKLLIYEQWNYHLIFIRSLLGVPFVVYLFFRSYRFNPDTWRFERRQKHA